MVVAAPPPFVQYVKMADARVGYVVGGRATWRVMHLYRTRDGGRTWADVTPGNPLAPPTTAGERIVFVPVRVHGLVVVMRSGDAGATWHASHPIRDGRPVGPSSVQRIDARHLVLSLGEGAAAGSSAQSIWRSDDGGATWRFVSRTQNPAGPLLAGELPFSCDKSGVSFATATRGWAAGACAGGPAFLYRTDDGGRTWRSLHLSRLGRCACDVSVPVFSAGAREGAFAVTGFPQAGGKPVVRVYWTTDGGAHWRATAPPAGRIGVPEIVDGRTAWVAGTRRGSIRTPFDRVFRTTDGGRTWSTTRLPFDGRLDAVDATTAVLAGEHALWRTDDGGRTWHTLRR